MVDRIVATCTFGATAWTGALSSLWTQRIMAGSSAFPPTLKELSRMATRDDRFYLSSHEWHKPDGDFVLIGISEQAVEELTDITYVEVTTEEGDIDAGEPFGEIESVKATSEMYCGISGEVVEVNQEVIDNPALLNEDCYDKGWIVKVKPSDPKQVESLLSPADYAAQLTS